jgi:phytoene/squalene synthetase
MGQMRGLRFSSYLSGDINGSDHAYCMDLVKKSDFDNYLCGLIWPKHLRPAYFAVRAYNVEIATIKDQIAENNNMLAGRMRFQWWRDGLEQMELSGDGDAAAEHEHEHPVLAQLRRLRSQAHGGLNPRWLSRSLEARCSDMAVSQYDSLEELEQYAEQSGSSLLYLLGEVLRLRPQTEGGSEGEGPHLFRSEKMEFCLSHAGVASGLTLLLRGLPLHLARGVCVLPRETMDKHGLTLDALFELATLAGNAELTSGQQSQADCLAAATHDVASQAFAHHSRALALQAELLADPAGGVTPGVGVSAAAAGQHLRSSLYLAALPCLRAGIFLDCLQGARFDPLAPELRAKETAPFPLDLQLRLLRALWQRKV